MEGAAARDYMMWMSHLETLTVEQLRILTVNGLPALHHLATLPCKPEDHLKLDQIIKLFKNAGCDLNKTTNNYPVGGTHASRGFTPLLVAIVRHNLDFVQCLLENGARMDVSDEQGFLPLHWAVFAEDMECFQLLIQEGALEAFTQKETSDQVHPILHTAVDEGKTQMVAYLLENGLVDLNQEAKYRDSPYHDSMRFTPLARALLMERKPIIGVLLKFGVNLSGFNELHNCILEGDVEIASMLVARFSSQDLANDKIDDKWALLCFHERVFQEKRSTDKTIELIKAYVAAGWNLNSLGKSTTLITNIGHFRVDPSTEFSLLHLACFMKSGILVKSLVKIGADVNSKTGGKDILYPLQVSILRKDWSTAQYLVANGADIGIFGGSKAVQFQTYWRSGPDSSFHLEGHFSSIELLLQLGNEDGLSVLEEMLNKGVPPPEKSVFHRAIYGRNCEFVCKMVEQLCGVQKVKIEDLTWLPAGIHAEQEYVPALCWFIHHVRNRYGSGDRIQDNLVKVVDVMGRFGYNFSLMGRLANGEIRINREEPLIFSVLRIVGNSSFGKDNLALLETLLKFDKVDINVRSPHYNRNPVECVIREWSIEWECDVQRMTDAVCLLIKSGVDVSGVTVGEGFNYYRGYLHMMQLLCCTGATIKPELFVPAVTDAEANWRHLATETEIVNQEIEELKKWKENFDRKHFTLKHLCLLKIRGELKTTGDLRKLYMESVGVMEDVMFQFMNSD